MSAQVYAGDVQVGDSILYEGEECRVEEIECEAVDTRMGGTYLYTFFVSFGDNTSEEFTRWDGDTIEV